MPLIPDSSRNLADLILFKVNWVILVMFQSAAVVPALAIIACKTVCLGGSGISWLMAGSTLLLGLIMDTLLVLAGIYIFPGSVFPVWLVLLWLSFAMTMPRGFAFMHRFHPLAQAAIGSVVGIIGYGAGHWLEVVDFGPALPLTLTIIGVLWGIFIPAVLTLAGNFSVVKERI